MSHRLTDLAVRDRSKDIDANSIEIQYLEYVLSSKRKCIRLLLFYQHRVVHLLIWRKDHSGAGPSLFETELYDTVQPQWGRTDRVPIWYRRRPPRHTPLSEGVYQIERQLKRYIEDLLPPLMQQQAFGPGSQLIAALQSHPETGTVQIVPRHIYQDLLEAHLPSLAQHDLRGLPVIPLEDIQRYIRIEKNHVFVVEIKLPSDAGKRLAILKLVRFPDDGQVSEEFLSSWKPSMVEVERLMALAPHPNILAAPLALVAVGAASGDTLAQGKYAGMLLEYHSSTVNAIGFESDEDIQQRITYSIQFVSAVRHMHICNDFANDLHIENTVVATSSADGSKRIILIDFEEIGNYWNFPVDAPEAEGYWQIIYDERTRQVSYVLQTSPTSKLKTIREEVAEIAEARERLQVFGVGCLVAELLNISLCFPWIEDEWFLFGQRHRRQQDEENPLRDLKTEAKLSPQLLVAVQQCCSWDPSQRLTLDQLLEILRSEASLFSLS